MTSKSWTIVCLTLALLILGCSDSEIAKVNAPPQPEVAGIATALSSRKASDVNSELSLPPDAEVAAKLEIPQGFQPPRFDSPVNAPVAHRSAEILVPVVRADSDANADSVKLLGFVNAIGLKALLSEAGTLKTVRLGDRASDAQVLAVVAPVVTLQQGDGQIELNLFQLPGFHDPTTVFDVAGKEIGGQGVRGLGAAPAPGVPGAGGEARLPRLPGFDQSEALPVQLPGFDHGANPSGRANSK